MENGEVDLLRKGFDQRVTGHESDLTAPLLAMSFQSQEVEFMS
ncbi:MAG: hypothetical protein ANABAC_0462 [Anaerolineae bacterium]|nr:MAG: hypothetical protein ANABAC_0462 [Anaerolineae bacterium]